jgi:uncharacterized protein
MDSSVGSLDPRILRTARAFVDRVANVHRIRKAILFGSRARHTERPDSDIDIAIILEGPKGDFIETKLDMVDLAYDLLLEEGMYIQPLPIWEDQWQHPELHSNPRLLRNIRREGIAL